MRACSLHRRQVLSSGTPGGAGLILGGRLMPAFGQAKTTVNFVDIGVGDPGDWSKYTATSGASVNLLSIGNAPSAILNVLVGGGGTATYDVINIVGGMQKPLVENDLVEPIDAAKLPNWGKDSYIQEFLKPGSPGFNFIGYKEKVYGVPTVLQGDSFAYLPEATGDLDSYGALFDPKWKGYVALEDNYTTAGQKTALYLKKSKLASIANPDDMTPAEIKTVVDFLVEKKKEGQFRTLWSSFEQAVNLLVSKEVKVLDCWEPMVFVAETKGVKAVYAQPKEEYCSGQWPLTSSRTRSGRRRRPRRPISCSILCSAPGMRQDHVATWLYDEPPGRSLCAEPFRRVPRCAGRKIAAIDKGVKTKFEPGVPGEPLAELYVESYESEWARFKAA